MEKISNWFSKSENIIQNLNGIKRRKVNSFLITSILKRTSKHLQNIRSITDRNNIFKTQIAIASLFKNNKYVYFNGNIFFDCFAPKWPGESFYRLYEYLLKNLLNGEHFVPFIPYLVLSITKRCVYRCEHCYAIHTLGNKDVLSLEKILGTVKDFQKMGVGVIAWEGGEPLLRFKELLILIEKTHNQSEAWLATTGYGITTEKAKKLKEAGLTAAIISLDHYDPDKHNEFRGNKKAFNMAINAVRIFRENGILPCIAICATREIVSTGGLYRYLELAKEIGVGFIQVIDAMPSGRYLGENVILTKAQLNEIRKFQIKVNTDPKYREYPGISARAYFEDDDHFGCSACNGMCYIDSSGNVQPCVFLQISFGNIMEERVQDIYKRMKSYFPHFLRGRCPAQAYHKIFAKKYEKTKILPQPYKNCMEVLEIIRKRGFPKTLQEIRNKYKIKGDLLEIPPKCRTELEN
ncbi:MAG: radical SAM protein [Candidatus Helarchaeota archaeon]|nr:radical SAM protein [Candidatus Helarchaeota archaeon]